MSLLAGTRVGAYEVLGSLGAGGMGEVYRARDSKLGRDVALKILPEAFASDPERLARFEREAKTLASLNHPHIAHIHGFEESLSAGSGQVVVRALVMELVDGDDLSERIARGPIPLDEALPIAKQIAEALEAAHEQGVIHRDLKPANIKVRADGTVKVLDFGLAKALEPPDGTAKTIGSPTITSPAMTMRGAILGTAAYMSPEQAKGKSVDRRADIWAFGVILFEMLTGRAPFGGDSITEVLAAVVKDAPDWRSLPDDLPPPLERLLTRCLQKDPRHRLRDIGDALFELETSSQVVASPSGDGRVTERRLPLWMLPLAVVLTALGTAGVMWTARPAPATRSVVRFDLHARDLRVDPHRHPIISPDGRRIAWVAGGSLWLRELDRSEARMLVGGVDPLHLAWSPDSAEIMFYSANRMWRVRTTGGQPVTIAEAAFRRGNSTPGGAWLDDGRIVFASSATGSGLLVVDARGGSFQPFFEPPPGVADFHSPSPLPGSRGVLVVADREREGVDTISVLANGTLHTVIQIPGERFESPVYSAAGFVLFEKRVSGQGIWAIPFSLETLTPTGSPFLVVANASWPSVSADGTLLHTRGDSGLMLELALLDRSGQQIRSIGEPAISLNGPRLSSDGRRIVATLREEAGARDLYSFDVATGNRTRLTFGGVSALPRWAPGNRVLFESGAPGTAAPSFIGVVPAEGGGKARELVRDAFDAEVSPDGRWLLYYRATKERGTDIYGLRLDPESLTPIRDQTESTIVAGPASERRPLIHPSGAFLAYTSEDSGRQELYLTRFPEAQGKWQISTGGVEYATWHAAGDRLIYSQGGRLFEVSITLRPAVAIGTPRVLFDETSTRARLEQTFDVTKDGDAFLVIRRPQTSGEMLGVMSVVQNWVEEFRSKPGQ